MELGLFLPALTDKGWFRAEVELDSRDRWSGEGRYCNWGSLHYDAGTEVVLVELVAHENGRTWALDVTAHVPPTPRTSAAPASRGSGQPNTSPSPSPP